jgi:hypothetical protein
MCCCYLGFGVGGNVEGGQFLRNFSILDLCCEVRVGVDFCTSLMMARSC